MKTVISLIKTVFTLAAIAAIFGAGAYTGWKSHELWVNANPAQVAKFLWWDNK